MICNCLSVENIINISGIALAIITFIIERVISSRNNRKTTKENWYLTIIVEPQLNNISEYYQKLIDSLKEIREDLDSKEIEFSYTEYLVYKAKKQEKVKKEREDLFYNFITLLKSFSVELSISIQNKLIVLDDICTHAIDGSTNDYKWEILDNQGELFGLLYSVVSIDKK